jgi:hypothetical protein
MKHLASIVLVISCILSSSASAPKNDFTAKADAFFKKYVKNGSVDYKSISLQMNEIGGLYASIGNTNISSATDNEKKAFYINAYNLIVIYWVTKHYPLKSPLDDSGFFDKVKHKVAGEEITLNVLEIKRLLQPYKDGRFHFALACAAKSCPPLASFAYTPEKLDQQLTERTTAALNNPGWIKVDKGSKKVELSKIFEWYKGDFAQNGKTSIEWVNQYRKEKIPATFSIGYYEYDWNLNDLKK